MGELCIKGGVAVITGAGSGIGAGLARHASSLGMRLVLADIDPDALAKTRAALLGEAITVATDVRAAADVEALAVKAYAAFGDVDLLFNNAGVLSTGLSWEIPADTWQRSLDVNIGGVVNGIRAFVPRLLAANRPARIINTASVGGFLPSPLMSPYSATKFAVVGLTEAVAGELAMLKSPVGVSLLAPGPVKSDIFREPPPDASSKFVGAMLEMLDENGLTPDEFAPLVFDAVIRGDYWIFPQSDRFDDRFSARNEMITQRQAPTFYANKSVD
jgi:NAD(P)-dependent dehydrogenase (short-subunit alcohol dehydrogenase family)